MTFNILLGILWDYQEDRSDERQVFLPVGFQLDSEVSCLEPDLCLLHPNQPRNEDYFLEAPVLAVEIVAEGYPEKTLGRKREIYFRHGAEEVWQVYLWTRVVRRFRANEERVFRDCLVSDVFPGLVIEFDKLFPARSASEELPADLPSD